MTTKGIEMAVRPLLEKAVRLEREAKKCRALAKEYEQCLAQSPEDSPEDALSGLDITLIQFQDAIRRKGGRVIHFAQRLHTSAEHIRKLIKLPDSGVKVGAKGWIEMDAV